ncbi:sensor histidine kinase [Secundilactobacillus folii]|uniref:histidine kinase n=1 Tax=Secundilactobacillus folii TaxID=2678357 RepID=A0A7X2XWR4_9LACO|nr:HAMP domain-containing sensor histidine kinase [Secundilactobacillus folii]MTV83078.1 HAMP domain-containing protein [Secundilactobacillus folii]
MTNKTMSNRHLIIRTYLQTILMTTLLSLLITIGVLFVLLFNNSTTSANKMLDSLQDTFVHVTPNTDAWQASSQQGASTTYVRIQVFPNASTSASQFYSTGTKSFMRRHQDNLNDRFLWVKGKGLFVYRQRHTQKAVYQVWLSLNEILSELITVLVAILVVSVLSSLFGIALINVLSRKITQPLTDLTAAVTDEKQKDQLDQTPLPVPNSPTEVKQLGDEFNQLLLKLNRQMQREQQFVSDASHELRTPLTAIRGYVSLLKNHGQDHPEVIAESLNFLDDESLRLQKLVEALLTITRNEKLEVNLVPVDVSSVIQEIIDGYHVDKRTIAFRGDPKVTAVADANSVKQIVLALLDNAQKYSPADSPITVEVKRSNDQVFIRVTDEGIGIPDAQKKRVFDRFYRVDAARSSKIPGTGLGLAIVSQLVALNKGKIAITDNVPHGSIFTIALKAAF